MALLLAVDIGSLLRVVKRPSRRWYLGKAESMCIVRWRISGGETLVNAATPTTVNEAMTNAATAGERLDRTICFLFIDTNNAGWQALRQHHTV
jgi:hypothetical protein